MKYETYYVLLALDWFGRLLWNSTFAQLERQRSIAVLP